MQGRPPGRSRPTPTMTRIAAAIRALAGRDLRACAAAAALAAVQAAGLRAGQAFAARLSPRQARRRGRRFRRPDPLDARTARQAGDGRMGALQARPAHRPYPGRRGAGHQCRPMGDRRRARARNISAGQSEAEQRWRTLFMVGDFKQAIFGFQGTDPRRVRAHAPDASRERRRGAGRGRARQRRAGRARIPRPVDRRQLPLVAGDPRGRRRGDRRGRPSTRWACPSAPNPHRAPHADRPGRGRCGGRRSRRRGRRRRGRRARKAGSTRPMRALCRRARARRSARWLDEAPVLAIDRAAAVRRATS